MDKKILIETPPGFSFKSTVYSHGWCELPPFSLDVEEWRLSYVFNDPVAGATAAVIYEADGKVCIEAESEAFDSGTLIRDTRRLLRLDDDLTGFYNSIEGHADLAWAKEKFAGRLLRSPTVFEDLVKTICTTNCSWALTVSMITNLVEKLGADAANGTKAFPTAGSMASQDQAFYRDQMRAGYRAPYFVELARAVASGGLDPESWLASDLPTSELKREMKKVKGVGDYAAENLLKLVGRYDGLALDSWLRSQYYKNHNRGEKCTDKRIEEHYTKFGEWRGLVIWCEMTEKWIN